MQYNFKKSDFSAHGAKREPSIEDRIIAINNALFNLCSDLVGINIDEIQYIHPNKDIREASRAQHSNSITDDEKRAIVAGIVSNERAEEIREEAMRAAGISKEEYDKFSNDNVIKKLKEQREKALSDAEKAVDKSRMITKDQLEDIIGEAYREQAAQGEAPPKTDWGRVTMSKDEKDKILFSIRANPKSSKLKGFGVNPKEFLSAFDFLEDSNKYSGPFIVTVVKDRAQLDKLSLIPELKNEVTKVFTGNYVILSLYDITAAENISESKNIYVGLNFVQIAGGLTLDKIGSMRKGGIVSSSQRRLIHEYLEAMDVFYHDK